MKRFERSNGLDTALYKNYLFFLVEVDHHKEECPSIIKADKDDRNAIRNKLDKYVDPTDVSRGQNRINIVTGKISNTNVNVEDAVQIGKAQLQEFEEVRSGYNGAV